MFGAFWNSVATPADCLPMTITEIADVLDPLSGLSYFVAMVFFVLCAISMCVGIARKSLGITVVPSGICFAVFIYASSLSLNARTEAMILASPNAKVVAITEDSFLFNRVVYLVVSDNDGARQSSVFGHHIPTSPSSEMSCKIDLERAERLSQRGLLIPFSAQLETSLLSTR